VPRHRSGSTHSALLWLLLLGAFLPGSLSAQAGGGAPPDDTLPAHAAPTGRLMVDPPRGASATARAVRIHEAPVIDGVLDEPFWATIEPITDFVQRDPVDGGVPSERTEVRIAYDEDNLYFGFILYDSDPRDPRDVLQRGGNIGLDDHVVIGLDTFNDRRNGYIFEMNSLGTQDDALFTDESIQDWNWDGVYRARRRHRRGLGPGGRDPLHDDPLSPGRGAGDGPPLLPVDPAEERDRVLAAPPATYRALRPGLAVRDAGRPGGGRAGAQPPGQAVLRSGRQKASLGPANRGLDAGLDLKYSLTSSLTLDLTYNTDFAQVEADNVQVNLDRFSLFFPEKREFFLERSGLFAFGEPGRRRSSSRAASGSTTRSSGAGG
jgi:hypothetical protein